MLLDARGESSGKLSIDFTDKCDQKDGQENSKNNNEVIKALWKYVLKSMNSQMLFHKLFGIL